MKPPADRFRVGFGILKTLYFRNKCLSLQVGASALRLSGRGASSTGECSSGKATLLGDDMEGVCIL